MGRLMKRAATACGFTTRPCPSRTSQVYSPLCSLFKGFYNEEILQQEVLQQGHVPVTPVRCTLLFVLFARDSTTRKSHNRGFYNRAMSQSHQSGVLSSLFSLQGILQRGNLTTGGSTTGPCPSRTSQVYSPRIFPLMGICNKAMSQFQLCVHARV